MQVDEDILFEANHFGEKVHPDLRWEEEGKSDWNQKFEFQTKFNWQFNGLINCQKRQS